MEYPFTISFSKQGKLDHPKEYQIIYAKTSQLAMFKWCKDNPNDIWRGVIYKPSTEEDIQKYSR